MAIAETVRSTCGFCYAGCGVLVHTEAGRVTRVEGDPESPVSRGALCPKGRAALEVAHHPDRLTRPLKRSGDRGAGLWEPVSWDQALGEIADAMLRARARSGARSVAFVQGTAKGLQDAYNERLARAFGTPNLITPGNNCFLPRLLATKATCGFYPVPDLDEPPRCIAVWGANLAATRHGEHERTLRQLKQGAELVVIDPVETALARRAGAWLRLKPGSDLALALGMLRVIIDDTLYDAPFVRDHTVGFEALQQSVRKISLEEVSDRTWIAPDAIVGAARQLAERKPASIRWGNGIEHSKDSFQTARAIAILRAITGNLDVEGGDLEPVYPVSAAGSVDFTLFNSLSEATWKDRLDSHLNLHPRFHRVLQRSLNRAIVDGDPYPVTTVFVHAANPLVTFENTTETVRAFEQLEFLAVADLFMTPTAALADIILPAATYLEYDNISAPPYHPVARAQQKATTVGACRSDFDIASGLAKHLGLGDPLLNDTRAFLDAVLDPSELSFTELERRVQISHPKTYRKYETSGFDTDSGKVELFSHGLQQMGIDPLPRLNPTDEVCECDAAAGEYPLTLTSQKPARFLHSGFRQVTALRKGHPAPRVRLHPETADRLGIGDGDRVKIETRQGRIEQQAHIDRTIDPRMVVADFGWWFPENKDAALYDVMKSNINVLTGGTPINPQVGSNQLRGIGCTIAKASK